jgi:hypothetical protein
MEKIEEKARLYADGRLSAREFLGETISIIGKVWESGSDEEKTEMAKRLADMCDVLGG